MRGSGYTLYLIYAAESLAIINNFNMATIVNTPGDRGDSSSGWAIAVIILLVVIAGIAFWYTRSRGAAPAGGGANVNVQVPLPAAGGSTGGAPAAGQ
jgi:hypothetical protein